MRTFAHILSSIASLGAMLFFTSACENEVQKVRTLTKTERIPLEVQTDLFLEYSDSTRKKMELEAPLAESYPNLPSPQREFRKGLTVRFFNDYGQLDSRLRADYALQFIDKNLWEARGDVVVVNQKGEQLNTEKLFWDSKTELIYTDEFVKITTPTEVIMGEGFKADQNFSNYEIYKVTGTLNIEDDV